MVMFLAAETLYQASTYLYSTDTWATDGAVKEQSINIHGAHIVFYSPSKQFRDASLDVLVKRWPALGTALTAHQPAVVIMAKPLKDISIKITGEYKTEDLSAEINQNTRD